MRATVPEAWLQVAGVRHFQEASMLVQAGVPLLGLPLGPGVVQEDLPVAQVADLVKTLPSGHQGVVITYLQEADSIMELLQAVGCSWVQLHGDISLRQMQCLRWRLRQGGIIKALPVGRLGFGELDGLRRLYEPWVDAFMLDTSLADGQRGATGQCHNWGYSRALVQACARPVMLAGGLGVDNVHRAIARVKPAGVDAHTRL